ncbi:hypothetical protein LINPERHAP1_LOCUS15608, partial [Linum perenne]
DNFTSGSESVIRPNPLQNQLVEIAFFFTSLEKQALQLYPAGNRGITRHSRSRSGQKSVIRRNTKRDEQPQSDRAQLVIQSTHVENP